MNDYDEIDADDIYVPTCRVCGDELTNNSELLDDTCLVCFQKKRYGRLLTAAEMGWEAA